MKLAYERMIIKFILQATTLLKVKGVTICNSPRTTRVNQDCPGQHRVLYGHSTHRRITGYF